MIDLHAHSTASDGTLTPTGLADLAAELGLEALALTDHDTVSGVEEARSACSRHAIRFIPGVELEVQYKGGEFHLLGLGLTESTGRIEETLLELRQRREVRNRGIVRKMQDDGVEVDFPDIQALSGGDVVGRPHFARFLVARGIARSVQDAFDRFLANDRKYYLPIKHLTVEESAAIIRRAGGRTIIAHPHTLRLGLEQLESKLPEWKELGVDGIEAYHSNAPVGFCRAVESLAERLGLFVTAGSDYHGPGRPDRILGHTAGGAAIDARFLYGLDRVR